MFDKLPKVIYARDGDKAKLGIEFPNDTSNTIRVFYKAHNGIVAFEEDSDLDKAAAKMFDWLWYYKIQAASDKNML